MMQDTMVIPGPGGPSGPAFASAPDLYDESDPALFYFGWEDFGGSWRIERQVRADASSTYATTGHATLADAWANRATLAYA